MQQWLRFKCFCLSFLHSLFFTPYSAPIISFFLSLYLSPYIILHLLKYTLFLPSLSLLLHLSFFFHSLLSHFSFNTFLSLPLSLSISHSFIPSLPLFVPLFFSFLFFLSLISFLSHSSTFPNIFASIGPCF